MAGMRLSEINEVRKIVRAAENTQQLYDKLNVFYRQKINSVKVLQAYADLLLFIKAYHHNNEIVLFATQSLNSIGERSKRLKKTSTDDTGLPNTKLTAAYSYTLTRWLAKVYPDEVSLHSIECTEDEWREILIALIPSILHPLIFNCINIKTRWQSILLCERADALNWILNQLSQSAFSKKEATLLFDKMCLYIRIHCTCSSFSRLVSNYAKLPHSEQAPDRSIIRRPEKLIDISVSKPMKLTEEQLADVHVTSKVSLLMQMRETDTITHAELKQIQVYDMGMGMHIALFSLPPGLRLPFDAYIGYMLFKNNMPCSYGGAWMFGKRAKIGINIFPAYRGGDSAIVFCQLMRLYTQLFAVGQFAVEPYQFGKNNPEGIRSGAFWFYYRLGYRPANKVLNKLAAAEYQKIKSIKGYRSSPQTLLALTGSELIRTSHTITKSESDFLFEAELLADATMKFIQKKYSGDIAWAVTEHLALWQVRIEKVCAVRLNAAEQHVLELICVPISLSEQVWPDREIKKLLPLIRAKAAVNEFEYTRLLRENDFLMQQLRNGLQQLND